MTAEQELTELFERCRTLAEDHEYPAVRRWLEANPGGKVLGHFQVYFPEEIAHADRLDFLSVFVTPPICDAARHACAVWVRNLPHVNCQVLYLPQNAASPHAAAYLRGEYRRLAAVIEQTTGQPITDEAMRRSIVLFNQNRRLLRELYRVKRETPWLLSVVEAYTLVRSGGLMPREDHNALLRRVLELVPRRRAKRQDKIRAVFEGGY